MLEYNIVVVDDDPVSLNHAKMLFAEENMHVTCVNSGKQLMKYIENNTPDLILLDIMMPETDGFETYIMIRRFEEHSGRPKIPVIFISGEDDSEVEEMGLVMGASDFVRKPLNFAHFLLSLRDLDFAPKIFRGCSTRNTAAG